MQGDAQRGVDGQDQLLISLTPWKRTAGRAESGSGPSTSLPPSLASASHSLPLQSHSSPPARIPLSHCTTQVLSAASPHPLPSGSPPGLLPPSLSSATQSRAGGLSLSLLHGFCFIFFHSLSKSPYGAYHPRASSQTGGPVTENSNLPSGPPGRRSNPPHFCRTCIPAQLATKQSLKA